MTTIQYAKDYIEDVSGLYISTDYEKAHIFEIAKNDLEFLNDLETNNYFDFDRFETLCKMYLAKICLQKKDLDKI